MKRKKRPNKGTKAYQLWELRNLSKKCLQLWSKNVREEAGNKCFLGSCKKKNLHAHHIMDSRLIPALRHDPRNGMSCCAGHHKFTSGAVHKNFIVIYDYMTKYRPGDIEYLRKHQYDKIEFTKEYFLKKISDLERWSWEHGRRVRCQEEE
jgi:hypothetical protein